MRPSRPTRHTLVVDDTKVTFSAEGVAVVDGIAEAPARTPVGAGKSSPATRPGVAQLSADHEYAPPSLTFHPNSTEYKVPFVRPVRVAFNGVALFVTGFTVVYADHV